LPKEAQSICLLARQRCEPEERLVARQRADSFHVSSQRTGAALVAALEQHVEQPRRRQSGILPEGISDEATVRIELLRTGAESVVGEPLQAQSQLDRVVVHAELAGDGVDFPVLGVEQAPYARAHVVGDHRATSSTTSRSRSRKLPSPWSRALRRRGRPVGTHTSRYSAPPSSRNISR